MSAEIPSACRELIHALNQRYREEYDRAERLQAELNDIHGSRAFFIFRWLRRLRRLLPSFRKRGSISLPSPLWGEGPGARGGPVIGANIAERAKVSILIPFKDHLALLRNCLHSLRRSTYRRLEIILLDNGSTTPEMGRYLRFVRKRRGFRLLSCPGAFNFAHLCNQGATQARGDYLLFLNNDIEVITPDWLERMLALAENPGVGVVGATLVYPDGTLQHAGLAPTPDGHWEHFGRGTVPIDGDQQARVVPAVTGACLLMRRDRFLELGGFDERFPVTDNDVDLCVRARQRGWVTAVAADARLMHFESLTRGYSRQS